jgi:hypothetical protein
MLSALSSFLSEKRLDIEWHWKRGADFGFPKCCRVWFVLTIELSNYFEGYDEDYDWSFDSTEEHIAAQKAAYAQRSWRYRVHEWILEARDALSPVPMHRRVGYVMCPWCAARNIDKHECCTKGCESDELLYFGYPLKESDRFYICVDHAAYVANAVEANRVDISKVASLDKLNAIMDYSRRTCG